MSRAYLLDTSVLSLLAPARPAPDARLADWLKRNTNRLHISTITIAELEQGICKLRRTGRDARAAPLAEWLDALIESGSERILAFDVAAGRMAGKLSDRALSAGRHPGFADVAIAAIAAVHDLVVLTLNSRHFAPLGIEHLDPGEDALP